MKKYPELFKNLDEVSLEKFKSDLVYHTTFLLQCIALNSPTLFCDYVKWAKELFFSIGVSIECFYKSLYEIVDVIGKVKGEQYKEVAKLFVDSALDKNFQESESYDYQKNYFYKNSINDANKSSREREMQKYTQSYINYVLSLRRKDAHDLIFSLFKSGLSVKDIYLNIFRNALYEVGMLWQIGKITAAQEHYFTATTQFIMSELYPYIFNEKKNGKIIVGASVSGELHEIGIRMICDILEIEGFDTYFLGANTPIKDIIEFAYNKRASAIMLSVTLATNLNTLELYVKEIKSSKKIENVKIIVGGRPFLIDKELYKSLGADYSTNDLEDLKKYLNAI